MKYLGGKQRLGKHLAVILKQYIDKSVTKYDIKTYMEPFCGALGVLQNMTDISLNIIASDYHPDLIEMWKAVKDGTLNPPDSVSEETYLHYKLNIESPHALKGFFGFGSSFGGRYYACYAQKYVKNKKENFCLEAKHSVERKRPLIQKVSFKCKDYTKLTPKNQFIYCDPPYRNTKHPIKYRRDVKYYDVFDSDAFWVIMREWSKTNVVIISELTAPDDFIEIWHKEKTRTACQSTKTRFKNALPSEAPAVTEKLFIHERHADL